MRIYVVIPVFNEEKTIRKIVEDVKNYLQDVIVVNDASNDKTKAILKKLPVVVLENSTNLGYVKSLEKGLKASFQKGADYVITFDADGQHQAKDLGKFISIINKEKPDIVIGKRSFKNRFMEKIIGLYIKLKYGISDPLCGFKAYKKSIFEKFGCLEKRNTIAIELMLKALKSGASYKEISIETKKRHGKARFGNAIKGNLFEIQAFLNILFRL